MCCSLQKIQCNTYSNTGADNFKKCKATLLFLLLLATMGRHVMGGSVDS